MLVLVASCVLVHRFSIITDMSRMFALRARVITSRAPKLLGNGYDSLKCLKNPKNKNPKEP
jgi:hypothetical protein